jgi:hypothetical protein
MITTQSVFAFGVHDKFQHSVKDPNPILDMGRMGLPLSGVQSGHPTDQVIGILKPVHDRLFMLHPSTSENSPPTSLLISNRQDQPIANHESLHGDERLGDAVQSFCVPG